VKVIIAGTRTVKDWRTVQVAILESDWQDEVTEVVSGASIDDVYNSRLSADVLGAIWANFNGIPFVCFPADWTQYGKAAGPIRNEQMAQYADALILVWDGKSKGSADMKRKAQQRGLKIYEHIVDTQETGR
jgi:hypothetical protein